MTVPNDRNTTVSPITCDDVTELAGLYVLDALEPDEKRAVEAHLATCARAHDEIRELGGVVPALAASVEPLDAPRQLKARVLAAVEREAAGRATTATARPWTLAAPAERAPAAVAARRAPAWAAWSAALAALLIVALVGAWGLAAQSAADQATARARVLSEAIEAFSAPGSSTAVLRGTGSRTGASGFAAFTAGGRAYVVLTGLEPAPAGRSYQAWYLDAEGPKSAGVTAVDRDGLVVIVDDEPLANVEVVAFTEEPLGGSLAPTTEPFAAGEVRPPTQGLARPGV